MINWNFSFGWLFFGLILLIVGGAIVLFYQPIADNFAQGVSSYKKVKMFGLIVAGIGLICMANLHTAVLSLISWIFVPLKH